MIKYDKLFDLLEKKGIKKYDFRIYFDVSGSSFERLRKNQSVSIATLNTICGTLRCKLEDIAEFVYDEDEFADMVPVEDITAILQRRRRKKKK